MNKLNFCKHGLCLLIERKERPQSIEFTETLNDNEYYYEHIICERINKQSNAKEYLMKWGPSKNGKKGKIVKWGYGCDLSWVPECDIRKNCEDYTGIDHYYNMLNCLKYNCLHKKNVW